MGPAVDVAGHLGLYTAFHRSRGNRILHGALVPVILFSMLCMQAYLRITAGHSLGALAHLGALLSLALVVVLATVDVVGALTLGAWLLAASALAGTLAAHVSPLLVVPLAIAAHLAAWYGTVVIGHERIEPVLDVDGRPEDSNHYFRGGYYLGRALGRPMTVLDRLVQFCIAPLAVVQDVFALLGLRAALERAVERERGRVLARLARGESPLGAPSRTTPPILGDLR